MVKRLGDNTKKFWWDKQLVHGDTWYWSLNARVSSHRTLQINCTHGSPGESRGWMALRLQRAKASLREMVREES